MFFSEMLSGVSAEFFVLVLGVFTLAGLIKGVVGLGLPTISMALLAILMPPAQAAALLIVPSLITNLWQIRPLDKVASLFKRIGGMQWGICVGTLAGALVLGAPAGAWASVSLGAALIAYAAWGLFGAPVAIPTHKEKWLGPVVGLLTGVVTAATGVFVVPAVPYLQMLGLKRDSLIQAMGISFTVSTVALAAGLWLNDSYSAQAAGGSVVMLAPALVGMYIGQKLRQALSPQVFRICFMTALALLGAYQIAEKVLLQG